MSYETVTGNVRDAQDSIVDTRNESMDKMESIYEPPEDVGNLSSEINTLLMDDSEYLENARAASRVTREERGFLESGFTEGVGEVAAIDAVYDVASGNVYANMYNSSQKQDKYQQSYNSAYQTVRQSQDSNNIQDIMDVEYEYQSELQDQGFYYQDIYQQTTAGYQTEMMDVLSGYQLDNLYFQSANEQQTMRMTRENAIFLDYMNGYQQIMSRDLDAGDKGDAMERLTSNYQKQLDSNSEWKQMQDNPYRFEDLSKITLGDVDGDLLDKGAWWSNKFTPERVGQIMEDIEMQIREEVKDTKERHQWKAWYSLMNVREQWGSFSEESPQAAKEASWWFQSVADADILNEQLINSILTLEDKMASDRWKDAENPSEAFLEQSWKQYLGKPDNLWEQWDQPTGERTIPMEVYDRQGNVTVTNYTFYPIYDPASIGNIIIGHDVRIDKPYVNEAESQVEFNYEGLYEQGQFLKEWEYEA